MSVSQWRTLAPWLYYDYLSGFRRKLHFIQLSRWTCRWFNYITEAVPGPHDFRFLTWLSVRLHFIPGVTGKLLLTFRDDSMQLYILYCKWYHVWPTKTLRLPKWHGLSDPCWKRPSWWGLHPSLLSALSAQLSTQTCPSAWCSNPVHESPSHGHRQYSIKISEINKLCQSGSIPSHYLSWWWHHAEGSKS